ncbi:MAG: response regulator [Spirochaetales bacterium]|nr:response regulator [Spirochaetales bacterium]
MSEKAPVVLIVDDVKTNLIILKTLLGKEGFEILVASDGRECREVSETKEPDLILLDIMMPGEDGFETCKKLKSNPVTVDIPVIFVSALNETTNKILGFSVGAVDYVTKPFDQDEIIARVKLHLRLSKAMKAVIETQANRLSQLTLAQQAMLLRPEDIPDAKFSVFYKSVLEAGGDFYDVLLLSKDIYGYFCADVSGHNLGSSLATSSFKALISQNTGVVNSPKETLSTVNRVLEKVLPVDIYLTAVYILLNRQKNTVQIVSAGHPPVVYLPVDGTPELISIVGDILGMFQNVSLDLLDMDVAKGDRFYTYTDGLIESDGVKDINRKEGLLNLINQIEINKDLSVEMSVQAIINGLFGSNHNLSDDILLLAFEV